MLIGFCHDHALILYVYLANGVQGVEESVLTVCPSNTIHTSNTKLTQSTLEQYYIASYSA